MGTVHLIPFAGKVGTEYLKLVAIIRSIKLISNNNYDVLIRIGVLSPKALHHLKKNNLRSECAFLMDLI